MPSENQDLFDYIASVSSDIRKFSSQLGDTTSKTFDSIDKQFDAFAAEVRGQLSSAQWLPDSIKPSPPPPPPIYASVSSSWLSRTGRWISRHRALCAAVVAFVATGGIMLYLPPRHFLTGSRAKRRAIRAANGARTEVIVVLGVASDPLTKSVVQDLERRGYIVYVVSGSAEDDDEINLLGRVDVRPLGLNMNDTVSVQQSADRFAELLRSRHQAFAGASPHQLRFAGFIVVPSRIFSAGPIETLSAEDYHDGLREHVVNTIEAIQVFIPVICEHRARVLMLSPSNVSALKPAFHSLESTICGALDGFTSTLQRELGTLGVHVMQIRMGSFDCSRVGARHKLQSLSASTTLAWPSTARSLYAENFIRQFRTGESNGLFTEHGSSNRGSSPRHLNKAVFDALTDPRPKRVVKVGKGSSFYPLVGTIAPTTLVDWMLGIRSVRTDDLKFRRAEVLGTPLEQSMNASQSQIWEQVDSVA